MRRKIMLLIAGIVATVGLVFAGSVPAQAFSPNIFYTANCPGTATYQQLVIVGQYSGYEIKVWAQSHALWAYAPNGVSVWYNPIIWRDTVNYEFVGAGSLNWRYHVDCFYN